MNVSMFTIFTFVLFFKSEAVNLKKAGEEVEGNFSYEKEILKNHYLKEQKNISLGTLKKETQLIYVLVSNSEVFSSVPAVHYTPKC